jgi:hypothetical protein
MADWDSADLLDRLRRETGRKTLAGVDTELDATTGYQMLSNAQLEICREFASHVPEFNQLPAEALTTSDQKTYTLNPSTKGWIGPIIVYSDSTLKGYPLKSGDPWDCASDYAVVADNAILLTCGRSRSFTPYVIYNAKPGKIDAGTPPVLKPQEARQAVVYLAAAMWAQIGGYRDPAPFYAGYNRVLFGADNKTGIISEAKKRRQAGVGRANAWWRTPDLGR